MANNTTTGILTATNPGATNIYATVAGLNSFPTPALVCPVASIKIHDAAQHEYLVHSGASCARSL